MSVLNATQANRAISVKTSLEDDVLLFHRMTANENLGRPFHFKLDLLSTDSEIKFQEMLGQSITVQYQRLDKEIRFFNGIVSQFSQAGSHGDLYVYRATLRPWFWFLSRTADSRIFQNKTVPDIIKEVFREHGYSDFEEALTGSYREWENCVQYRETDFNFISRLLEQEGIYYYFKHEEGKHTLVLADSSNAHEAVPGYEEVPYFPPEESERRERDHLYSWALKQRVQPGIVALNDFDFKKPKANLLVNAALPREHELANYEVYDYPGEYWESGDGENYARTRIEELHAQYEHVQAQGNAAGLSTGCLFELTNYFAREDQNREYLITSARCQLGPQEYESRFQSDGESQFTINISAIDSEQPFRTPSKTKKPIVQGPQTAVIVGKSGEEIWTDKYGRVKAQFHWDRYAPGDENSSCWMRVSQVHAGKGFGGIDIPRIGEEVIVSFLEGDPDRPIITGRVYNDFNKPPTDLPAAGMVSGLKSNSTPGGGGYNEMTMDDSKGKEQITIHGQYDMSTTVEHDQSSTINNNRTDTIAVDDAETVGNNQTTDIGTNQTTTIGANQTISVGAARSLTVGASESISVGASKTETIAVAKALTTGAAYQVSVGAAMNETVGGAKAEEIGGIKSVNVGGVSSENIGANKSVNAGGNITESAGKDMGLTSGKKMTLTAGDDFAIKGGKKGVIEISDELTIKCGKAIINLKKSGEITINGKKITIKGSGDVVIKGKKILQN